MRWGPYLWRTLQRCEEFVVLFVTPVHQLVCRSLQLFECQLAKQPLAISCSFLTWYEFYDSFPRTAEPLDIRQLAGDHPPALPLPSAVKCQSNNLLRTCPSSRSSGYCIEDKDNLGPEKKVSAELKGNASMPENTVQIAIERDEGCGLSISPTARGARKLQMKSIQYCLLHRPMRKGKRHTTDNPYLSKLFWCCLVLLIQKETCLNYAAT